LVVDFESKRTGAGGDGLQELGELFGRGNLCESAKQQASQVGFFAAHCDEGKGGVSGILFHVCEGFDRSQAQRGHTVLQVGL
jgi:hypothetical protein